MYCLHKDGDKSKEPSNGIDEQSRGILRWAGIRPGDYRLLMSPPHADFSANCVVAAELKVKDGDNTMDLRIPTGRLHIVLTFHGVSTPKPGPHTQGIFFRADRIGKDAELDHDYRQWLHTYVKDGIYTGTLRFLEHGSYRITAFNNDDDSKLSDLGYGVLQVTEDSLKNGTSTITINKPVEQAGAAAYHLDAEGGTTSAPATTPTMPRKSSRTRTCGPRAAAGSAWLRWMDTNSWPARSPSMLASLSFRYMGGKTVGEDRLRSLIKSLPGTKYSAEKVDADIGSLYYSGYVDDILVDTKPAGDSVRLIIVVTIRPLCGPSGFIGNRAFSDQKLALQSGLHPSRSARSEK